MGVDGPALYPSLGSVLGLLRSVGFQQITKVLQPSDVLDLHGYGKGRRVMLLCQK